MKPELIKTIDRLRSQGRLSLSFAFFLLVPALLHGQSKEFEELLNRERKLVLIRNDSLLSDEYISLALKFTYIDSVKSNDYFRKYLTLAIEKKDTLAMGHYYYYKAMGHYYRKNYKKAIEVALICMRLSRDRYDFLFLEVAQIPLRSFHYLDRLEEAERLGLEIIGMRSYENSPVQIAKIHFNLGLITMNMMKDSSVWHFYKAVSYLKRDPDNKVLLPCYHHISCYYRDRGQLDSAFRYAELAFRLSKDSVQYNNVDFISPANNYQELLSRTGRHKQAQQISRELQMRQYDLKVNSITYPEVSKQIGYLEHLRYNQRARFIILLIISFSILVVLSFFVLFNRKMKKKQTELTESLDLNQVLMRETNHRVKNNFQMMMSMLSVNAGDAGDSIGPFVEQTRARIASMARVHEMFLQNTAGTPADPHSFFREVIQSLDHSLSLREKNISIRFGSNCDSLKSDKMVTLGLIINELVVNSVKYAFSGDSPGEIVLSLEKRGDHHVLLFSDNGPGIDRSEKRISSSGMSIVFSLAIQLKGEARILEKEGTVVEIIFKP